MSFSHAGRHNERAAVGVSTPVPNWFFIVTVAGNARPVVIVRHRRCAAGFVIGVVTEWPPVTTVLRTGLQCSCTTPSVATNPPDAKLFFSNTFAGVLWKATGCAGVVVADTV